SNHAQAKSDTQNQDGGVGVQGRSLDYRQQNGNGNHDDRRSVQEHPHHKEQRKDQQHQGQAVQIGACKSSGYHVRQAGDIHQGVVSGASHENPHKHGGDLHGLDERGPQILHIQFPGNQGIHHGGESAHTGGLSRCCDSGIDAAQHQNDDGNGGDDLFKHPHLLAPGGTLGLGDAGAQLGIDGTADADIDDEQQGQAYAGQRTAGKQPACGHAGIGRHDDHDGRGRDNGAQAATCQHGASGQRFIITTVQHSWQC
ncbi:RNA methyltransferase, partial [Dysosmobacter welbionis]